MRQFARPHVVVSSCLGSEPVRSDGGFCGSILVKKLKEYADLSSVCPEVSIGLGVPRTPTHRAQQGTEVRLCHPNTGRDFTPDMRAFAVDFTSSLREVDGFVLKARSPACGPTQGPKSRSTPMPEGLFGGHITRTFPNLPVEDEETLNSPAHWQHFLTRIFLLADFRQARKTGSLEALQSFHARNQMLLLLYCSRSAYKLNSIMARGLRSGAARILPAYSSELYLALHRLPRSDSAASVLRAAFQPFEEKVSDRERALFVSSVVKYQEKRIPVSVPLSLLRSHLKHFHSPELAGQTLLEPFPSSLEDLLTAR